MIKFRAWDESSNKMVYCDRQHSEHFIIDENGVAFKGKAHKQLDSKESLSLKYYERVLRNSGRKDHHGSDIYEGDIIQKNTCGFYWLGEVMSLSGQFGNDLLLIDFETNAFYDEDDDMIISQPKKTYMRNSGYGGKDNFIIGNRFEGYNIQHTYSISAVNKKKS